MHTDGIEIANARDEEFGLKRVEATTRRELRPLAELAEILVVDTWHTDVGRTIKRSCPSDSTR
jgi:hypothetical protein